LAHKPNHKNIIHRDYNRQSGAGTGVEEVVGEEALGDKKVAPSVEEVADRKEEVSGEEEPT
jgi:hypothetical protein